MLDAEMLRATIAHAGREDRALLASNPSARFGPGTWTGASGLSAPLPWPPCPGQKSDKRTCLGHSPKPIVTRVNTLPPVGHMSLSLGLWAGGSLVPGPHGPGYDLPSLRACRPPGVRHRPFRPG